MAKTLIFAALLAGLGGVVHAAGVPALEHAVIQLQAAAAARPLSAARPRLSALAPTVARRIAAEASLSAQPPFEGALASTDPSDRYLILPERSETAADGSHQYGAAVRGTPGPGGRFEAGELQAWHRRIKNDVGSAGRNLVELSVYASTLEGKLVREGRQTTTFDTRSGSLSPDPFRQEEYRRLYPRILQALDVPSMAELIAKAKRESRGLKNDKNEWNGGDDGAAKAVVYFRETARLGGLGGKIRTPFLVKLSWLHETMDVQPFPGGSRSENEQRTLEFEVSPAGVLQSVEENKTYSVVYEWGASSADPMKFAEFETLLGQLAR